jgi:capsular polysaccharide biosynthesis protein
MSQQALDLRRSIQIVRRRKVLVALAVTLGILAGGAYAVLKPPTLTSTALVVLPQAVQNQAGAAATATGPDSYMATQEVVAGSTPVLSLALKNVRPGMSLDQLRDDIQVGSPTSYTLSITAEGRLAGEAEATANAVAQSYIAFVGTKGNPFGYVPARMLQAATSATGSGLLKELIITCLVGALIGGLIGVIVSLAISRKDGRLRERDEIANSVGIPVLASLPVAHLSDAAGWTKLLQNYNPGPVYAWRLRKLLQHAGVAGYITGSGRDGGISSIAVLSLSSDRRALALGPQLACFASSLGIPTALVIGPQGDADVTAPLRTACSVQIPTSGSRETRLRVSVCDNGHPDVESGTALIVVVIVVDERAPRVPDTMRTTLTALGVSAGAATAEQLARAAVSAANDGREIAGILVADPEPTDNTTGQVPQLAQPIRRGPTRLHRVTTEIRR